MTQSESASTRDKMNRQFTRRLGWVTAGLGLVAPRTIPLHAAGPADTPAGPVTCSGMGFGEDEESRKLRRHFDRDNA